MLDAIMKAGFVLESNNVCSRSSVSNAEYEDSEYEDSEDDEIQVGSPPTKLKDVIREVVCLQINGYRK
jgi:hypothetical protein